MCGISPTPVAEHENDDICAEALLSLQSANEQDLDRFYCPFPSCKRSFAELWRLKVHFRAPPNVRGSGKERGHGMRLTHCPKCGTALKIGGHHVRCSAREAARQHKQLAKKPSRRKAAASSSRAAAIAAVPLADQQQAAQHQQLQGLQPTAGTQQQQQQQDLQRFIQQLVAQQGCMEVEAANGRSADCNGGVDDDVHGYHNQQQMFGDQSTWYAQQYQQQQQHTPQYQHHIPPQQQSPQQQQQMDRRQKCTSPVEHQQLQRLQELLRRVDQQLGYDHEAAAPAAVHLQHYSGTSSIDCTLPQQRQQQYEGSVRPHSSLSSDISASSAAEGSAGDRSSGGGSSGWSTATTATAAAAAADTEYDSSRYFALMAQQQQQQQQSGLQQLLQHFIQQQSGLQQQQQHQSRMQQLVQHFMQQQQEPRLATVQLPPPQMLDCRLATDCGLNVAHDAPAAAVSAATRGSGASAPTSTTSAAAAACGTAAESYGQQIGLVHTLLQNALAASSPVHKKGLAAAIAPAAAAAASVLPQVSESELLQLLKARCLQ